MAVVRFAGFLGENRAIEPKLLPETVLTLSRNQKPGRGDLRSWRSPAQVATVPAGRQTIYRMGRDTATDGTYWHSWTSVVHAVRGFSVDDTTEQTFFTGDGPPKFMNNLSLDGTNPQDNPVVTRPMGLPAPLAAPAVDWDNSTSATPTLETYFYVYTYVNDLGWESAPSPVSAEVTRDSTLPTYLDTFSAPPSGNYNITSIRIYRTQTGTNTNFYFLREIAIGTTSTTDDNRTLGELLETTTWLPAPGVPTGGTLNTTESNLTNLTPMWNGMMAGITGHSVRVCEPYVPYAWPAGYDVIPPDGKPVGLGVFGQNMVVLTTSRPVVVNGSSPDGLDQQKIEMPQGCVASRSIVSMGAGVAWASEDGLCWYGVGGAKLLTAGLMLREDWQELVPSSIIGCMYEGLYFGSYDDGSDGGRKGFFIDPNNPQGIYFMDTGYVGMYFDELRDHLYVLDGTSVKKWDSAPDGEEWSPGGAVFMTYRVKSKLFKMPFPLNLAAAEVVATSYPVTFKLYADNTLVHTETVAGRDPFWLPSGFRAYDYQIELSGTGPIQGVALASSKKELGEV